jgi:hypothetical protein
MQADVAPGSTIVLKIKKTPTSAAAAKTLSRLFAKDPANKKRLAARKATRARHQIPARRGGRIWLGKSPAPRLVQPVEGDTCTLLATTDVLRDLGSVSRFVNVSPR